MKTFKALSISILLLLFVVMSISVVSPSPLHANGLNLNSIGAKASSMGTAFVGLADDYSAILMNPAGIAFFEEPSVSLFVSNIMPNASYNFDLLGATLADTGSIKNNYPVGTVAYFQPLNNKMVAGIGAYVPSGAGARWPGDELALVAGGNELTWHSRIFMVTIAPAFAVKLTEKFSVGATLNLNIVKLIMERPGGGTGLPYFQYEEEENGFGIGATLGMMYKPNKLISLGATMRLPVKATVKGTTKIPFLTNLALPGESDSERTATWPMLAAVGISITPNDKLTILADIQYTNWKKWDTVPIEFAEPGWQAIGLEEASEFTFKWDDTLDFRFGVEYKISSSFALRAGYYVDNSPAPDETLNIMLPSIDYKVITWGFGFTRGKFNIDFGFEYLTGDDRFVDPFNYEAGAGMPGFHGMDIFVANVAFTYKL